jgi:hypothetical protein
MAVLIFLSHAYITLQKLVLYTLTYCQVSILVAHVLVYRFCPACTITLYILFFKLSKIKENKDANTVIEGGEDVGVEAG